MNATPDLGSFRAAIHGLAAKYRAENVRIFGSGARGQATAASDVDLLVHFREGASLLDQVGFKQELETLLGCRVDIVSDRAINRHIRERVLHDAVPL
ncbi:MAG: nucleotidyltransferase family protein [Chthoniobacteraceae bacterium]